MGVVVERADGDAAAGELSMRFIVRYSIPREEHMSGMCAWKIQIVSKNNFTTFGDFIVHPSEENVEFS